MEKLIRLSYSTGQDFKDQVNHLLRGSQSPVIIESFVPDDNVFSDFIRAIGSDIFINNHTDPNGVFGVKVTVGKSGFHSVATSNFTFPNHTDCSDEDICPNAMALLCIKQAGIGGETTISPLTAVLDDIDERLKHKLLTHQFTFRNIKKTILEYKNEAYQIRYNRVMIESYGEALTLPETEMLDELDQIIKNNSYTITLQKGDLFLIRNDRFLHGRLAFPKVSDRLMKRIRFTV